jgi:hypothetical protein
MTIKTFYLTMCQRYMTFKISYSSFPPKLRSFWAALGRVVDRELDSWRNATSQNRLGNGDLWSKLHFGQPWANRNKKSRYWRRRPGRSDQIRRTSFVLRDLRQRQGVTLSKLKSSKSVLIPRLPPCPLLEQTSLSKLISLSFKMLTKLTSLKPLTNKIFLPEPRLAEAIFGGRRCHVCIWRKPMGWIRRHEFTFDQVNLHSFSGSRWGFHLVHGLGRLHGEVLRPRTLPSRLARQEQAGRRDRAAAAARVDAGGAETCLETSRHATGMETSDATAVESKHHLETDHHC